MKRTPNYVSIVKQSVDKANKMYGKLYEGAFINLTSFTIYYGEDKPVISFTITYGVEFSYKDDLTICIDSVNPKTLYVYILGCISGRSDIVC